MSPPTRTEFLRSRVYRCALAFNKRNEERLKNIQELLERIDQQKKKGARPPQRKRSVNSWVIPECNNRDPTGRNNEEASAILAANTEECSWILDKDKAEYILTFGDLDVMKMPPDMYQRLKPFQRDAVKWVAGVGPTGGILADDMGMGKTFMSIASIGARMRVGKVKMVLVVAPVSVLSGWKSEGDKYLPKFVKSARVVKVHGGTHKDRQKIIRNAWKDSSYDRPYVIISSWGLVAAAKSYEAFLPPRKHCWDYVILDEAHEIRNHNSNRFKCCYKISRKADNRLLLTGTPFQNNSTELWSITHMATGGKVLGKLKEFNKEYGKPIKDARCRNASSLATREGAKANKLLQEKLKPYLLRRLKLDFLKDELPIKRDACVWVKPSKQQAVMYKKVVESNSSLAQGILSDDKALAKKAEWSAFQMIRKLQSLCSHPLRLLKGGSEGNICTMLAQKDVADIVRGSKKLELVLHMLKGFKADDHRTLLFSQSTQNLDIIEYVLLKKGGFRIARLDGSVSEKRRKDMVELFQAGQFDVLLLSTGAGGVGLTLTRASRVIVYDPSWNPSEDAQAVDRAYRIGQTEEVRVYRLFVAGSVEEKMYEKQVHKNGLEKTIFTEGNATEKRLFDKHELSKVFAQIPGGSCEILKRFEKEDVAKVLDAHHHNLITDHNSVIGISDHTAVYREKRKNAFSDAEGAAAKRLKLTTEEAMKVLVSDSEGSAAP